MLFLPGPLREPFFAPTIKLLYFFSEILSQIHYPPPLVPSLQSIQSTVGEHSIMGSAKNKVTLER